MRIRYLYNIVLIALLISSCARGTDDKKQDDGTKDRPNFVLIPSPAATGSGEPNLDTDVEGNTFLSWVEETNGNSYLRYSRFSNDRWSNPKLISQGEHWFVNWADFPSLSSRGDGSMVAHYLAKNGEDTFAYGVNMVFSSDYGMSWSSPIIPHETETETEHGFVSIIPYNDGYFATWLDGRETGGGHGHNESGQEGSMSIRAAFIGSDGVVNEEFLLDDKTCDCCQTSAAMTSNGPIVAYRDRSDTEIRDISIVRWNRTGWSEPMLVHPDNWLIPGCPVNGPVLAAMENNVALAWFTSPDQNSQLKLAFSGNGGESFYDPTQIDLGHTIGRLDMEMVEDGSVYIVWMEAQGEIGQMIVAHYSNSGKLIDQFVLADNRSDRASGFPRMTRAGNYIIIAWRDTMNEPEIKTARIGI